jgi:ectoine hydroxylase-related dioxygenase (phytanoyl-CoA dioxygenase family)
MIEVTPTPEETAQECFEAENLNRAVEAVQKDGFVVINNVIDHAHLDILRERMEADLVKVKALPIVPHNFVWGNIQQDPPPQAEFVFRDVVANPFVCQVTSTMLGAGAFNSYMSGNSNVPGSNLQRVHVDAGQLWPNLKTAHPVARLAVNLALDDTTVENGAIELWPGSHLDTRKAVGQNLPLTDADLDGQRAIAAPVAGTARKGSFLLRDLRLWHRGTPNVSDATRFMIAMIHNVGWYKRTCRFDLDKACAPVFEGCPIENAIPLVDVPSDHIGRNSAYDYDGPN